MSATFRFACLVLTFAIIFFTSLQSFAAKTNDGTAVNREMGKSADRKKQRTADGK